MPVPITDEEVQAFHDRGYLVLRDIFDPAELDRARAEADRILELLVNASLATGRRSGRLAIAERDGEQQIHKVQPVNDLSRVITELSEDERFLAPMRTLMSDEPVLMEEKLNYKQPLSDPIDLPATHETTAWPPHNDWAYYRQDGYPRSLIWSAVCLDDCTRENGPIHVWPGSHVRHLDHEPAEDGLLRIPDEGINYAGGEDLLASAGSVLMFHSLLVHNSRHNGSTDPRRLLIYSHYPESEFRTYFDERNGPTRYRESAWEGEYHRRKWAGEFEDRFTAPSLEE